MAGTLFVSKTGCHQAIFWQHDIEPLRTETQPHELAQWHGYGCAVLRLPGRAEPLRFVVAHLDPYSPLSRCIESDRLRGFVGADPDTPTVLAMDANTVPPGDPEPDWSTLPDHRLGNHLLPDASAADRAPVQRLLGSPGRPLMHDVGAHLGDRSPTFGAPAAGDPWRRIDLFLLSPALLPQAAAYRVVTDPRLDPARELVASDHRPIELLLSR
jgi:endonuclease/exonuclease/phosphatase family metal-dependent hydrolase